MLERSPIVALGCDAPTQDLGENRLYLLTDDGRVRGCGRYLVVYNDLSGPHSEGLRNTRSDIHAAMQASPQFEDLKGGVITHTLRLQGPSPCTVL